MSRAEAIAKLIELDVARWGEAERDASAQRRGRLSHGRALNTLAHYDAERVDKVLAVEARRTMTPADWAVLRDGRTS